MHLRQMCGADPSLRAVTPGAWSEERCGGVLSEFSVARRVSRWTSARGRGVWVGSADSRARAASMSQSSCRLRFSHFLQNFGMHAHCLRRACLTASEGDSNTPACFASRICIDLSESKFSMEITRYIKKNEAMQGPELNVFE